MRRPARLVVAVSLAVVAAAPVPARAESIAVPPAAVEAIEDLVRVGSAVERLMFAVSQVDDLARDLIATRDAIVNDPILGPMLASLIDLYRDRTWRASAYADLSGESSGTAGLAAGAEVAWESGLCRLFLAGVDAQAFHESDRDDLAYVTRVGGCLPLPGNTVQLEYRRLHDVRRSLLALPVGRGGRYEADAFDLGLRFWRFRTANHLIDVMPLGLTVEFEREPTAAGAIDSQAWELDMRVVSWHRRGRGFLGADRAWDFMVVRARGRSESGDAAAREDTVAFTLAPVRVEGLAVGGGVHLDAQLGGTMGQFVGADGFADRLFWRTSGELTLWSGTPRASASLGLRRDLEPVTGAQLLSEDRLVTSLTSRWRHTLTTIDGHVGAARPESVDGGGERVFIVGAGARGGIAVTDGVTLWLRGEVGRFVAADEAGALASSTGARLMLSLTGETSWQR